MAKKISKGLNNCRVHASYAKKYREREELLEKLLQCYDIEVLRSFIEQEYSVAKSKRAKEESLADVYSNIAFAEK